MLTALAVEFDAVEDQLTGCRWGREDDIGTQYRMGWVNGTPWQVALAEIGRGNDGAAVVAAKAVQLFVPRMVMFVGVAGALKDDVALGDVVVATKVYAVHGGKEDDGGFRARPSAWQLAHDLDQLARRTRKSDWADELDAGASAPGVHFEPVAVGEVVLNSSSSPLRDQLRAHYEDAVAIEMESAGMARAVQMSGACPALTVRGISDRADGAKHAVDRRGGQAFAARNAAAFAIGMIRGLEGREPGRTVTSPQAATAPRSTASRSRSPRPRPPRRDTWSAGEVVDVDGADYLLQEEGLVRRGSLADGSARELRGRALRVGPAEARGRQRFVWLRRVDVMDDRDRFALEALSALRHENLLLGKLAPRPGLPTVGVHRVLGPRSALLSLAWPGAGRKAIGAAPTLSEAYRQTGPLPGGLLARVLPAFADLADTLDDLHHAGFAHRCLEPDAVLLVDGGALRLRDLGLAFRSPVPGEGPAAHRAPEQWPGDFRRHQVGAATDVFQLASLTYWLAGGMAPDTEAVVPVRVHAPDAPASLERLLGAALDDDPAARPTGRALAEGLRQSAADLTATVRQGRTDGSGTAAEGAAAC